MIKQIFCRIQIKLLGQFTYAHKSATPTQKLHSMEEKKKSKRATPTKNLQNLHSMEGK